MLVVDEVVVGCEPRTVVATSGRAGAVAADSSLIMTRHMTTAESEVSFKPKWVIGWERRSYLNIL